MSDTLQPAATAQHDQLIAARAEGWADAKAKLIPPVIHLTKREQAANDVYICQRLADDAKRDLEAGDGLDAGCHIARIKAFEAAAAAISKQLND